MQIVCLVKYLTKFLDSVLNKNRQRRISTLRAQTGGRQSEQQLVSLSNRGHWSSTTFKTTDIRDFGPNPAPKSRLFPAFGIWLITRLPLVVTTFPQQSA